MRRFASVLVASAVLAAPALAAPGWIPQTSPTTVTLRAVDQVDLARAWAVGDQGTIVATTDGGEQWTLQSTEVEVGLRGVSFSYDGVGLAVGESGTILRTTDDGATWVTIRTDWLDVLNDVSFIDVDIALAVGQNPILQPFVGKSTDAGLTWQFSSFYIDGNEGALTDVTYRNPDILWASAALWDGTGAVVRTDDGGASWHTEVITANVLNSVETIFPGVITAVGEAGAGVRMQGAWTPFTIAPGVSFRGVEQIGASRNIVVGSGGRIYATTDFGATWPPQSSGTLQTLEAVDFYFQDTGTIVGAGGTILRTTTGGWPTTTGIAETMFELRPERLWVSPNPFDETTRLRFRLTAAETVILRVFDLSGREIARRSLGDLSAGEQTIEWTPSRESAIALRAGAYPIRVETSDGRLLASAKAVRVER